MLEYFAANMWQVWAVISVLGLILELSSGDFFIICFAIGAVGAAIVSPFAGITLISIFTVRPFALRYLYKGGKNVRPSNADALIGQMGTVSETIQAGGFGRVDIGGDNWKAVGTSEEDIPQGARVRVVGRESIIITVEKTN